MKLQVKYTKIIFPIQKTNYNYINSIPEQHFALSS